MKGKRPGKETPPNANGEVKGYDAWMHCTRPDRDVPKIKCGYPFPCPWHTARVDITGTIPTVREGLAAPMSQETRDLAYGVAHELKEAFSTDPGEREAIERVRGVPRKRRKA